MKKCLLAMLLSVICSSILFGEVPEAMTLQSVIRLNNGELASNRNVSMRISILQGSADGSAVYVEQQSGKTNANGLITLKIGLGSVQTGNFADIDWVDGPYFICVAADVNGGMDYVTQSTTQLLSVPYAMQAKSAERLSGQLSYNDLTDLPELHDFSGRYEDLSGQPELSQVAFSGSYNDLSDTPALAPVATSGSYNDLTNQPVLAPVAISGKYEDLSVKPELAQVATSGKYEDLNGKPALATVATTGSYNDLKDKPDIAGQTFSGEYADLKGKPNIADSIRQYGFDGDYNKLSNKPYLSNVAYSGDYNDLKNVPIISGGMVSDYNLLANRPNLRDTVEKYAGSVTDYNQLTNRPSIKDSVKAYTGAGDYNQLINRPNIKDSVVHYGFSGNYNDLTNAPDIAELLAQQSFSGKWEDLENKPTGSRTGALMYYSTMSNSWQVLEPGNAGDVLIIGNDGYPSWISAAFLFKNMSTISYVPIQFSNYDERHYDALDEYGFLNANGYMEAPEEYELSFTITPKAGWGVKNVLINGKDNDSLYYTDKGVTYIDFTVENIEGGYTIEVNTGTRVVELINVFDYPDSIVTDSTKEYFTLHYDTTYCNVGYDMPFVSEMIKRTNFGISSIFIDGVDKTDDVLQLNQIRIEEVADSMQVVVTYKENLFNIGDLYYEGGQLFGIVYKTGNGGTTAEVLSVSLIQSPATSTWEDSPSVVSQLGTGWQLPTTADATAISKACTLINSTLAAIGTGTISQEMLVWTTEYESDRYAVAYYLAGGYSTGQVKTNEYNVIAIKQITK